MGLLNYCLAGSRSNGTHEHLHAPVLKGVVSVYGLLCIVNIVLELEVYLVAVDTACCVDLLNSHLSCVLYSLTVNSSAACDRTDTADLEGSACGSCCSVGGSSIAACGIIAASCKERYSHAGSRTKSKNFL